MSKHLKSLAERLEQKLQNGDAVETENGVVSLRSATGEVKQIKDAATGNVLVTLDNLDTAQRLDAVQNLFADGHTLASMAVPYVASDRTVDRYAEIVEPRGIDLTNYNANPIILWGHSQNVPAIGKAQNTRVEGDALLQDVVFHGVTEISEEVGTLVLAGIIRGASIGFIPKNIIIEDGEPYNAGVDWVAIHTRSELLEVSIVNIPANPSALQQMKSVQTELMPELVRRGMVKAETNVLGTQQIHVLNAVTEQRTFTMDAVLGKLKESNTKPKVEAVKSTAKAVEEETKAEPKKILSSFADIKELAGGIATVAVQNEQVKTIAKMTI